MVRGPDCGPPWRGPGGGNHTNINTTWTGLDWGWTGWENHQTQSLIHLRTPAGAGQAQSTLNNIGKYPGKHSIDRIGRQELPVLSVI